ncbi:hypothetical protein E1B28_001844 [Marasmius oreades]|uniref:Nephrocystin 3-like N-terminal domain-containing protein n=1 Tax=Marasmius oreades TaxID=181124 RepID=A0A9P7V479_9AGAR|nr:uncharacterized protein E1B28_001844 [Marasmius oreades]KAG7100059.1 hypothetical protein E1B28_001844 [Marasmius oreades]
MMQRQSRLGPPSPLQPPSSLPSQHMFNGAHDFNIGQAVFNNVGHDQIQNHNHNYYYANLLWEAIKDVGASHNSEQQADRGSCLAGTREAVLDLIRQWRVSGCQSSPVCWLSGAAGVGKSAIALTVAEECEKDGLVASFFFFRSDPKRNNPSSLILSIAHGLAVKRPHLKALIDEKIAADPGILRARLENQYKELILENLDHSFPSSARSTPDLVIIDGLDECSDAATQRRILSIIFSTYRQRFHSSLRYLICSRPESWIQIEFRGFSELTKHIKLDDSFRPQYDIELYFNQQFQEIRRDPNYSHVVFPDPWPAPHIVRFLVEKADGQFIFATTATEFIKAEYALPTDQLCIILDTISNQSSDSSRESPFNDLDKLYLVILRANPDRDKRLLPVLAMIVIFSNSSPAFIELILGHSPGTVVQTLRAMHSVLDVRDREDDIRIYHKSFTDFLFDWARSREFFIDRSMWTDSVACRWTRALTEQCRNDPELLKTHGHSADSRSLRTLVQGWNDDCLARVDHLMSEVDAFYHVALSVSAELVGHDMLLHLLAAVLLLPSREPRSSDFIQSLLGFRTEDLSLASRNLLYKILLLKLGQQPEPLSTFLLDRERSHNFFVEKDYQSNFLAVRCLRLFQMDEGPQDKFLVKNWAHICTDVDNPTEELFFELGRIGLGGMLAKSLDYSHDLFHDFETISTWLSKFQTNSLAPPDLINSFENIQRGFHIRWTALDVEPGFHDDVITISILCGPWIRQEFVERITRREARDWRSTTMNRLFRSMDYDNSRRLYDWFKTELRSAEVCRCSSSMSASDFDCISTPIPSTDLHHISIPAACARIVKGLVPGLGFGILFDKNITNALLLLCPGLLTQCLPLPELLPHFRTLLDFAKTLDIHPFSSRDKLLPWLEKFPAHCAHEVEAIRIDLLSLTSHDEEDDR